METRRKFSTAKLSIRKPGSSSDIISTYKDPGLGIESFAVINLRRVSTNESIISKVIFDACDVTLSVYIHTGQA